MQPHSSSSTAAKIVYHGTKVAQQEAGQLQGVRLHSHGRRPWKIRPHHRIQIVKFCSTNIKVTLALAQALLRKLPTQPGLRRPRHQPPLVQAHLPQPLLLRAILLFQSLLERLLIMLLLEGVQGVYHLRLEQLQLEKTLF